MEENFERLTEKKWKELADIYSISEAEVQEVLKFVQKLTPAPAEGFQTSYTPFILPELAVTINDEEVSVSETKYKTPLLTFNTSYFEELKHQDDKTVHHYIGEKKKEYDILQAGLEKRKETILRVGTAIARHQAGFFRNPEDGLASLQLNDLAQELQLNESTVSRAVRESYIQTQTGTYELKSFLSRRTSGGDSQDQLEKQIRELVDTEDKQKPLSDQTISEKMAEAGMQLSRRGVTKYRKNLSIPSSTQRKIRN
ncbi:RNA polymerase factor sigma-54 [Alkalibacterium pelagium]|uniref:RNA polymerase factor sigma-54 n=1 Tax=Alkalibacterium pelagium TaxID=426702 RepID=UPI00210C2504|nr:hypothetical protein [Alkalibacterium pelagium]